MKKRKGITLIELIIYLAITTIVLVVIIDLVTRIAQNRGASQGQGEVNQNARILTERLAYSIQEASAVSGSLPADNLDLTVNATSTKFLLQNGQILYQEGAGAPTALTDANVSISPIAGGESIFNELTNGINKTIQIRFKVTYKQSNFSRDFETAALLEGK